MPAKKNRTDKWTDLTWNDLEEWAGRKIVSRGKSYQRQERVSNMAQTDDGGLLAWVNGTELYATKVAMGEDGLPASICTCPYEFDCKHGVALVIEYLEWIEKNRRVPKAKPDDDRLEMLEDENWDDESDDDENAIADDIQQDIDPYLKSLTKAKLIDLIHELAKQHPEMARDLSDRRQLKTGDTKGLVARLKREIRDIGDEPGWQNYWNHEGFTPDYSGIRQRLETLLKAGHTDTVLTLGQELVATGMRQVAESHDEGETAMEIAACLPVIVEALDRSSLDDHEKLNWALDIVLADEYDICEDFAEYLHRKHPKSAWHTLSDRLLSRLDKMKRPKGTDNFSHICERDRLSDWAIHALDRAGRKDEIIPLCEAEAKKTGNYERVVNRLVSAKRYEAAERWIQEGLRALKDKWPGTAAGLRNKLQEIRTRQKDWPAVAAIQVEEFVRRPSQQAYTNCQKTAAKVKAWPKVRESLLTYLEKGEPPWKQKGWPLPESGLDTPKPERKDRFPLVNDLIQMALLEKKPERVLHWYDRLPKKRYGWHGADDDTIATAVQTHAPDRAVAIWQQKTEQLIALVKPKAYQEAGKYLRKAAKVMAQERKVVAWDRYLQRLREHHARKPRLIEVLDNLEDKPIIKKTARSK